MKNLKINVPEGYEIDKDESTFENIVFKKKNELPKSWEDLRRIEGWWSGSNCEILPSNSGTFFFNKNVFKKKEQAVASLALAQLSQLRDVYRQGWTPDWENDKAIKYCIIFYDDGLYVDTFTHQHNFISFQDMETVTLFLKNFKELIEQAKPLMS